MLISVIVPIYYGKKYITNIMNMLEKNKEKSLLEYSIEVIFVNDSPNESVELRDIPQKDCINIKLFQNEKNMGIHYSRVKGLDHAEGEYILFFDQDDMLADNYFESQIKHIGKADVVVANGIAQYSDYNKFLYRYWIMQWTIKYIWFYAKFDCRIISPGQCLIKKDSIPDVWKNNILRNNGADDYYLWLLMLTEKRKFRLNRQCIYTHVYTSVNASLDNSKMHQSVYETLEYCQNRIEKKYVRIIEKRLQNKGNRSLVKFIEKINRE